MAGGSVDRLGKPGRGPVATTVVRRAEVRAALDHLPRDPDLGLPGVIAVLLRPAARVARRAAGLDRLLVMAGVIPVRGPLPHVPDHVVEPVGVRREAADGRGALVAVLHPVL